MEKKLERGRNDPEVMCVTFAAIPLNFDSWPIHLAARESGKSSYSWHICASLEFHYNYEIKREQQFMLLSLSHTKEIIYCLHFDVSFSSLFSRKIYIRKIIIFTRKYYMWFSRRITYEKYRYYIRKFMMYL